MKLLKNPCAKKMYLHRKCTSIVSKSNYPLVKIISGNFALQGDGFEHIKQVECGYSSRCNL